MLDFLLPLLNSFFQSHKKCCKEYRFIAGTICFLLTSVGDLDPDPQEPHVYEPPDQRYRYGAGSKTFPFLAK
jgi:hypothetical protein